MSACRMTVADLNRETVFRLPTARTSNQMVHLTRDCHHMNKSERRVQEVEPNKLFNDTPVCSNCIKLENES